MNQNVSLERMVATWMTDEVSGRVPERLLDETLQVTSRLRPEPRWLALLKEPSMTTQARVAVGIPSRRLVFVAALAALLGLSLLAALVGSQLLQPPPVSGDDWPMFRGDATHSGVAATGPIGNPVLRWRFQAHGPITKNISIVRGVAYVESDDGVLHALDASDGTERWRVTVATGTTAGTAVVDGLVYVTDTDGRFHAFDATNGTERWASRDVVKTDSTFVVGRATIYVSSLAGEVVALDAKTGDVRWRTKVADGGDVYAPALAGDRLFVGGQRSGFVALDAQTGEIRWRADTGSDQLATSTYADGIAYSGGGADSTVGTERAFDPATGRLLWKADEAVYAPAVANGVAYSGSRAGVLVARDARTGRDVWRRQFHGVVRAPVIAGNVVYVPADGEHRVYGLDAASGDVLWSFDVDSANECCIAVSRGTLFAGTRTGTVYAIGGDGLPLTARGGSSGAGGSLAPGGTASSPASEAPSIGSGSPSAAPSSRPTAPTVSTPEPARYVSSARGAGEGFIPPGVLVRDPSGRLWAADPPNGRFAIFNPDGSFREYWGESGDGAGQFNLRRANGDGYGGIAFAKDGSFFVLDVGNDRVEAFDSARHFVRSWGGFGTGPGEYNDPVGIAVGPDGLVYVLDDVRGVVEKYRADGSIAGSFSAYSNLPGAIGSSNGLFIGPDGLVYVGQVEAGQIAVFEASGALVRSFGLGYFTEQVNEMAFDSAGRVFVTQGVLRGDAPGVLVFDRAGTYITGFSRVGSTDGAMEFPCGIALDGKGRVFVIDAGDVANNDPTSGRLVTFELQGELRG